jgi:hypothetical protein
LMVSVTVLDIGGKCFLSHHLKTIKWKSHCLSTFISRLRVMSLHYLPRYALICGYSQVSRGASWDLCRHLYMWPSVTFPYLERPSKTNDITSSFVVEINHDYFSPN